MAKKMNNVDAEKRIAAINKKIAELQSEKEASFKENKAQYNIIERNIHTTHEVDGRKITGSVEVPLSLCFVDMRYQKFRTHKNLKNLENNWDERKLSPITIVPHPEENRFAIVDGQGRYKVSMKNNRDTLPATVLLDAPTDPDERLKFEASFFIGQDLEVEKLRPVEKHPSRIICGDKAAIAIEEVLNKYGIRIEGGSSRGKVGVLGSYSSTYDIAKKGGYDCLDYIFSVLKYAKWDEEKSGLAHFYTRTLEAIWEFFPDHREQTHKITCEVFRATTPELMISRARAEYPEREPRAALPLYMQDIICDRLGISDKQFYYDGKHFRSVA